MEKEKMEKKPKIKWDTDFFIIVKRYHWFIIPSFIFYYNKKHFLETGVLTPCWGFTIRWFVFMVGFQRQQGY